MVSGWGQFFVPSPPIERTADHVVTLSYVSFFSVRERRRFLSSKVIILSCLFFAMMSSDLNGVFIHGLAAILLLTAMHVLACLAVAAALSLSFGLTIFMLFLAHPRI